MRILIADDDGPSTLLLKRALDTRGMLYQRQGRLGFYLPSIGEEALQAGSAACLATMPSVSSLVCPPRRALPS